MDLITVAGSDRIAIATFIDFLKHCLKGDNYVVGILHSLMTEESIEAYMSDLLERNPRVILSYYAKRKVNVDPEKCLPQPIMEKSTSVVWFELYNTEFKIVKDSGGFEATYRDRWKANMERMNKLMGG